MRRDIPRSDRRFAALGGVWLLLVAGSTVLAQEEYKSADEAYREGVKRINARQESESIAPLEAALKLAPDDAYKARVYEALQRGYRTLPEVDKMVEACEFLIARAETPLRRSSAARGLVSFLFQRGKLDYAVERYEKQLAANADDVTALVVLAQLYERTRRNAERAAELSARLAVLEKQRARARAEKLEQDAGFAPQLAGVYWKDAALAWLDADDKARAKAAAEKALAAGADARSDLLTFYWHRQLGDVFLAVGDPKQAIPQFKAALERTTIEGHIKDCRAKLAEAETALKSAP